MDRIPKEKLKVGMNVWIKTTGNKARYGTEVYEAKVTKVGNKYFYLSGLECDKFDFEFGVEKTDYCKNYKVYLTKQEISDEEEFYKLRNKIRKAFGSLTYKEFTLEQLRDINKIVDGVDDNGR